MLGKLVTPTVALLILLGTTALGTIGTFALLLWAMAG